MKNDIIINKAIKKGLEYTLKMQSENGSWSGPLSSRIRETFFLYLLSKMLNWEDLKMKSGKWLDSHIDDKGQSMQEQALNSAFISVYNHTEVDLSHPDLYDPILMRKTLIIYCLALINGNECILPSQFKDIAIVKGIIDKYTHEHHEDIKGWALAELLCSRIILGKYSGELCSEEIKEVIDMKKGDNWFGNPATTAICLIALKYSNADVDYIKFKEYFIKRQQSDGGWSYCELPLWDTGLSIETLNLALNKHLLNDMMNLERAYNYIQTQQNDDGGWGFNEVTESEADTSSIILYSLRNCNDKNLIQKAIKYFLKLQFKNAEFKGLWPVWRKSEYPSPEVVAHIVTALSIYEKQDYVQDALKWLKSIVNSDHWSADWGRNLPYSIYSIIRALGNCPESHLLIEHLLLLKNNDGGFGAQKNEASNASATANAVLALKLMNSSNDIVSEAINTGLSYLIMHQLRSGTWPGVKEVIGPRPFIYADDSSTHNFTLQALLT